MNGIGRILDKATGKELGIGNYSIDEVPAAPGRMLRSFDLEVDVAWVIARDAIKDNRALVLETADGRFLDFWVTGVSHDTVTVTATGALRNTL
jgi:hypothetical protein